MAVPWLPIILPNFSSVPQGTQIVMYSYSQPINVLLYAVIASYIGNNHLDPMDGSQSYRTLKGNAIYIHMYHFT